MFLVSLFGILVGWLQSASSPDPEGTALSALSPALLDAKAHVRPALSPVPSPGDAAGDGEGATVASASAAVERPLTDKSPAQKDPVAPLTAPPRVPLATQLSAEPARAFAPTQSPGIPARAQPERPSLPSAEPKPAVVASASTPGTADASASPSADLVDLNSASIEQLNALRGGGMIGRAITRGRPYRSAEDLMRKRILNRSAFERVKDQVTVR
nr:helix-hairpin-helix domain-containing protein [Microvirga antarctica]